MATKTPQTPDPPLRSGSRRSVPPPPPRSVIPVLSPSFSRVPLSSRLAAAASSSSSSVEHPCVTLWNWWLVRVEGEERKIAVSGFTERDDLFTSAPIAKCHGPLTLEDEDGVGVLIYGSMNCSRMGENGFSRQICDKFMIGFPYWWESWHSRIESQPTSFSNSQEGSSQSTFQQLGKFLNRESSFIKNLLNDAKNFPRDYEDAFMECPRFEEYTFDDDISTKEKSAVPNDASEGPAAAVNELDNMGIDLIVSSTSQERGHVDNSRTVFAPTENCTSDETYKEAEKQNDTVHPDAREQEAGYQRNPVASLKNQGHLQRTEDISLNQKAVPSEDTSTSIGSHVQSQEKAVGPSKEQRSAQDILLSPTRLPVTRSPMPSKKQRSAQDKLSSPTRLPVTRSPMPSKKQISAQDKLSSPTTLPVTRSPLPSKKQRSAQDKLSSPTRSPMPSNKQRSAQDKLSSPTRSPMPSVHHSPLTRGRAQSLISISTPESLNMKRTKSGRLVVPPLDLGCERILYNNNHLLLGVAPVELHSPPKGNKTGTPTRKKRAR